MDWAHSEPTGTRKFRYLRREPSATAARSDDVTRRSGLGLAALGALGRRLLWALPAYAAGLLGLGAGAVVLALALYASGAAAAMERRSGLGLAALGALGRRLLWALPAYAAGLLGLGAGAVVLALALYAGWRRRRRARERGMRAAERLHREEEAAVRAAAAGLGAARGELPAWVSFPDVERAEWLNKVRGRPCVRPASPRATGVPPSVSLPPPSLRPSLRHPSIPPALSLRHPSLR
ncbi:uncharacterized protein LOC121361494, partial [Pyrgilauda ruficollis]|uniref:uncharacterized protein LOC121361494 n=1 Tax=Pyrgilauda ruficollis TaxID=221976 RepID=UPI001B87B852